MMDALHAARRWADAWARAWRTHDAELVGSLYADDASFRSQPFRELDDPAGYARWAFDEEAEAECRFAEPAVSGHDGAAVEYRAVSAARDGTVETIAGVALLRFGADGRVVAERDYWNLAPGRAEPRGLGSRPALTGFREPPERPNPYLPAVRRPILVPLVAMLAAAPAACAYQPDIEPPGAATGVSSAPATVAPTGPTSATPTSTADGCPVGDPAFCEQAAFLANALVLSDADAVFDLSRRVSIDCADLDRDVFPQCDDRGRLEGYVVGDHQGHLFVNGPADYRRTLAFFVEAVDEEYSDEFGGAQLQVLGVSTCGKGANTSHQLVYLVGLGDPTSTLPADRFLGTYELTKHDGSWAIAATYVGLYTDWQLVLDDPLSQIACGDIQPWVGAAPNLNPPRSESQPTPIPATGST